MPTYTQIGTAQVVGAGGSPTITFSSIPQTYTDLVMLVSVRTDGTTGPAGIGRIKMRINSITTNYSNKLLYNIGVDVPLSATGDDLITFFYAASTPSPSTSFSNNTLYFCNYSSTTLPKTVSIDSGTEYLIAAGGIRALNAAYQPSTDPITTLTISIADAANFVQHSSAYLYGVSNA
jgi:hypothetical protein